MDKKIRLSICVPIYNRSKIFIYSLESIIKSIKKSEKANEVEIIISDNASEENIEQIVSNIKNNYPEINIVYHRNSVNIGMAANFINAVNLAVGEFCWIVGCDDFILDYSVDDILECIVSNNEKIDFISIGYKHFSLSKFKNENDINDPYRTIRDADLVNLLDIDYQNRNDQKMKWEELLDLKYNRFMFIPVMTNIFRKSVWDLVDKNLMNLQGFYCAENMYPHCLIFAKCMTGKQSYLIDKTLVLVGDDAREWANEDSNDFWNGSHPVLIFNALIELPNEFNKENIPKRYVEQCEKVIANIVAGRFIQLIIRRYITKSMIKSSQYISIKKILKVVSRHPSFYILCVKSGIRYSLDYLVKWRKEVC